MPLALVWYMDGTRVATLDKGKRYFVGRLDYRDFDIYGGARLNPLETYIYSVEPRTLTPTGYKSPVVGRRHALLTPKDNVVEVRDHGREGRGTLNGTFISDRQIPPGGSMTARPGDTIRLASSGPSFLVARVTDGRVEVPVKGDVPLEVPAGLSRHLNTTVTRRVGDNEVIVVREGTYNIGSIGGRSVVMKAERPSTQEKFYRILVRIEREISDIIIKASRREYRSSKSQLELLLSKQYSEWIKGMQGCEGLKEEYEALKQIAGLLGQQLGVDEEILDRLETLRMTVRDCIDMIDVHT